MVLPSLQLPNYTARIVILIWTIFQFSPAPAEPKQVWLPKIGKIEFTQARVIEDSSGGEPGVVIPLKRVGRLFLIEGEIDGTAGNFVFDTGADKMVLNITYFRNNLIAAEGTGGGLTGTSQPIYVTQVGLIRASSFVLKNQTADVTELGQIENRRGVKILGLMGMSLFEGKILEIDLRNGYLKVTTANRGSRNLTEPAPEDSVSFYGRITRVRKIMFLKGAVGGRPLEFCLDTGAESNVLSSSAPRKILESISITGRSELTGVGGASSQILYGTLSDFSVGTVKYPAMQVLIANLTALSTAYDYPVGGILGFDFFEKGVFRINLVTKEITIRLHENE